MFEIFGIKKRKGGKHYVHFNEPEIASLANWGFVKRMYKFGTYKGIWVEWLKKRSQL